jgi:hypothetical protein
VKKYAYIYVIACILATAVVNFMSPGFDSAFGYTFGISVFSANLGLLILVIAMVLKPAVVERWNERGGTGTGRRLLKAGEKIGIGAIVILKLSLWGGAAYLAIVVWQISIFFFIGGVATGLIVVTAVCTYYNLFRGRAVG